MAAKITRRVTLTTVMMLELMKAVIIIQLRVLTTSTTFSQKWKPVGQEKSRRADCCRSLNAIRMMKMNGMTNTTKVAAMAAVPPRIEARFFIRDPACD